MTFSDEGHLQGVSELNLTQLRACTASVCSLLAHAAEDSENHSEASRIGMSRVAQILRNPRLSLLHPVVSASLREIAVEACHAIDAVHNAQLLKQLIVSLMAVLRASDSPMLLTPDAQHLWKTVLLPMASNTAETDMLSCVSA